MPNQLVLIQKSHNSGLPSQALRHTAKPVVSQTADAGSRPTDHEGSNRTCALVEPHVPRWKARSVLVEMRAFWNHLGSSPVHSH